ncbi:hypothetical protein [uncultured Microbacterium sp.]|uniref:hypothetical protein n=1 Tax=uncultured Microbacterium sp. TaxID=191216 RepID=UPI0026149081|nr:hypothetical protein [uncultured Microbacterium sp.]
MTCGALLTIAASAATHVGANLGYDDSRTAYELAVSDAERTQRALTAGIAVLDGTVTAAQTALAADSSLLIGADNRADLEAKTDAALGLLTEHTELADHAFVAAEAKPVWAWELFDESRRFDALRDDATTAEDEFTTAAAQADEAALDVSTSAFVVITEAAEASAAFESAHIGARNTDIIALRRAAQELAERTDFDAEAVEGYVALETAAAAMIASEAAEVAEKQGPLYDARLEVEAFARSLAPGVLLDFDWSPIVNGYGHSDSMAGYATWWYGEPGHANIELTDSVAAYWPGERSKSLVAHEVGHAISVKCQGMYDDSNQDTIEHWATAWAISMGFHSAANGTSAYGPPPQELIDAASGCR